MRLVVEQQVQPCSSEYSEAPGFPLIMRCSADVDDHDLPMLLEDRHWRLDTVIQGHDEFKPAQYLSRSRI